MKRMDTDKEEWHGRLAHVPLPKITGEPPVPLNHLLHSSVSILFICGGQLLISSWLSQLTPSETDSAPQTPPGANTDTAAAARLPHRVSPPAPPSDSIRPPRDSASIAPHCARPTITVETVGRCSSQFSAICGTVLPVSFATSSIASTTLYKCSSSTGGPASTSVLS